jgi:hypothetical protein
MDIWGLGRNFTRVGRPTGSDKNLGFGAGLPTARDCLGNGVGGGLRKNLGFGAGGELRKYFSKKISAGELEISPAHPLFCPLSQWPRQCSNFFSKE